MWGDLQRDALEERAILVAERRGPVGVDVDLADDPALVRDRHHDLRARRGEAGEVAGVGVDVVDDLRLPAGRGRSGAAGALMNPTGLPELLN